MAKLFRHNRRQQVPRRWRNARTFSAHDVIDVKPLMQGAYELTG
jgi:hypothetical protein